MKLSTQCKMLANRLLAARDQVVTNICLVPSPERLIATLAAYGQTPVTVFDVGVAEGTP